MPIPPMKPSSLKRLDDEPSLIERRGNETARLFLDNGVVRLQERAYRDGYAANDRAERMLAALRECTDKTTERVARAICISTGRDPDAPFIDRHGRKCDFPEWERWRAEGGAAIAALHDLLASIAETQAQERGR